MEASDEAGHDGDFDLKLKTIANFDKRIIKPIYEETDRWSDHVCMAILPDHPTPVEFRTHVNESVPFIIRHKEIEPDDVYRHNEYGCADGFYGLLKLNEFMDVFMNIK